ncbi:MAG: flavin reductase family protein [Gemmataceae bacterium]
MSEHHETPPLAAALGRIPSGLFIVTLSASGHETGMLASWLQQCSFEPPQISVAIKRERDLVNHLKPGARFMVNILDSTQTNILIHFGKGFAPGQPAFEGLDVSRPAGSPPVLNDALAFLECRVVERFPAGDHELLIGQVTGGKVLSETGQPMVHIRKSGLNY